MEFPQTKQKKKKDKKPLYFLGCALLFFGLFIYFISKKTQLQKAIEQVQLCTNANDVKGVFDRYKFELVENDENGIKQVSSLFQNEIRSRLNSFNLGEEEVTKCIEWLPTARKSINLIVVPDLSRRIIDTLNNPNQISNDILVLQNIWKSFVQFSKLKQDTKDRLIVDITDIQQAGGQFRKVADSLFFDLSIHKGKSNRLYFTPQKDKQFEKGIIEMYQLAKPKPLGADYRLYFRREISNRLKKSTLFDSYINKVIIITDGYIETEGNQDTKIEGFEKILYQAVSTGNILDVITSYRLNIPKENIDLSNTEFLICEVNERQFVPFKNIPSLGKNYDYDILKVYWEDWLNRMNVKNKPVFLRREPANTITAEKITDFIGN